MNFQKFVSILFHSKYSQNHWFVVGVVLFFTISQIQLYSQEVVSKLVLIGKFQPQDSESSQNLENEIQSILLKKVQSSGFTALQSKGLSVSERISEAKQANARFLLEGFYNKKNPESNLNLYIQVYNPDTGQILDAYSITDEIFQSEGI